MSSRVKSAVSSLAPITGASGRRSLVSSDKESQSSSFQGGWMLPAGPLLCSCFEVGGAPCCAQTIPTGRNRFRNKNGIETKNHAEICALPNLISLAPRDSLLGSSQSASRQL